MVSIIVASKNPVKVESALQGFQRMFPETTFSARGLSVPSGVSDQPMTSDETLRGARNRAEGAREALPDADYWVGIEGGVEETAHGMEVFAWVVVMDATRTGESKTGTFFLPDEVVTLIRQGVELGEADDRVFGRENSKQGNGAVGILTGDIIHRTGYYVHAVVLALIPFKNPTLTFSRD
ncbi:MAG: inosine/xanthosine triphosphatase [Aggregatilineales bacterium]